MSAASCLPTSRTTRVFCAYPDGARQGNDRSAAGDRQRLFDAVLRAEAALREVMAPDKINLAALGNVVPHLHWHVIPRFADDPHFPNAVWGARLRDAPHPAPDDLVERLAAALSRPPDRARGTE